MSKQPAEYGREKPIKPGETTTQGITLTVSTSQILVDLAKKTPGKHNKNRILAAIHNLLLATITSQAKPSWWRSVIKKAGKCSKQPQQTPFTREGYTLGKETPHGIQINLMISSQGSPEGQSPGLAAIVRSLLETAHSNHRIAKLILNEAEKIPAFRSGRQKKSIEHPELEYGQPVWIIRGNQPPEKGKKIQKGCKRKVLGTYMGYQAKNALNKKAACWIKLEEDDPLALRAPYKKDEIGPWPPYRVKPRS